MNTSFAVLTNACLLDRITSFQSGLTLDVVVLARTTTSHDTLPQLAVRSRNLALLKRLYRLSQQQPDYFTKHPKLSFSGAWLEAVRTGDVALTSYIDTLPCQRFAAMFPSEIWEAVIQSGEVAMVQYVATRYPQLKWELTPSHISLVVKRNDVATLRWIEANIPADVYQSTVRQLAHNVNGFDLMTGLPKAV